MRNHINYDLKVAILKKFGSQANFVMRNPELRLSEPLVSLVIRGRKKLTTAEKAKWALILGDKVTNLWPLLQRPRLYGA